MAMQKLDMFTGKENSTDFEPLDHTKLLGLMQVIGAGHEAKKTLRGKINLATAETPQVSDKNALREALQEKDQIIAKLTREEVEPASIRPALQIDSSQLLSLLDAIRKSNKAKEEIINAFAKRAAANVLQYWNHTRPNGIGPNTAQNMVMAGLANGLSNSNLHKIEIPGKLISCIEKILSRRAIDAFKRNKKDKLPTELFDESSFSVSNDLVSHPANEWDSDLLAQVLQLVERLREEDPDAFVALVMELDLPVSYDQVEEAAMIPRQTRRSRYLRAVKKIRGKLKEAATSQRHSHNSLGNT